MTEATIDLFTCPRMHGGLQLSPDSCARSYKAGKRAEAWETAYRCRGCEIGAEHAGEKTVVAQPRLNFCVRCGSVSHRIVGRLLCVSCFNRQREYIIGMNARGTSNLTYRPPSIWNSDHGIQVGHDADEVAAVCRRLMDVSPTRLDNYGSARPIEVQEWWQDMVIPHSLVIRKALHAVKWGIATPPSNPPSKG